MSTQLSTTTQRPSALAVMASRFSVEPQKLLQTLKNTVFKGATDDELLALVVVSNEYGLNPLTKEIFAFAGRGGGIVPVVSVDGWANMANSHPQFDGLDFEWEHDEQGRLVACTCVIYRKDRTRPIRVTEYLAECRRNTEPWKMEHRMLRHKALSQGVRIAFGFGGVYDAEEAEMVAERIIPAQRVTVTEPVSRPKLKLVEAAPAQPAQESAPEPSQEADQVDFSENTQEAEESSISPRQELQLFMESSGITLGELGDVCRKFKLLKGTMPLSSLADLSDRAVMSILSDTSTFLAEAKGGQ